MKLLIVAATQTELDLFYHHYNLLPANFVQTLNFDILITGVGMTATAFELGKYLNSNYQLVINVGIAGSFDRNIELGQLVNIKTDIFAELGAEDHDNFIKIDNLGFGKSTYNSTANLKIAFKEVKGITVNKVHGNTESIEKVKKLFAPETESMEGAAVFYACEKYNIPCLQIRAISNYVEPRNKETWQIGLAIKNLNEWLVDFI
jgi:futalosine hydrolase